MTDLDITRLCAEAMGYEFGKVIGEYSPYEMRFIGKIGIHNEITWDKKYDPLHDDAQAMALVKKFRLDISACLKDGDPWDVAGGDDTAWRGPIAMTFNQDLNRAICECVAKMQKAKHDSP